MEKIDQTGPVWSLFYWDIKSRRRVIDCRRFETTTFSANIDNRLPRGAASCHAPQQRKRPMHSRGHNHPQGALWSKTPNIYDICIVTCKKDLSSKLSGSVSSTYCFWKILNCCKHIEDRRRVFLSLAFLLHNFERQMTQICLLTRAWILRT
jgi:hypothetical protein